MKRFLLKILALVVILILIDNLSYWILRKNMPSDYKAFVESKSDFNNKAKYIKTLIIGDSHIADAINPRILEAENNLAYNYGVYHSAPYEYFQLLKYLLKTKDFEPKLLIIGTNPVMFTRELSPGRYTPLFINSFYDRFILYKEANSLDLEYFSSFKKESYLIKPTINNILRKTYEPTRVIKSVYNGYIENIRTDSCSFNSSNHINNLTNNKIQIEYFKKLIYLAKENDIEILIVNPPIYYSEYTSLSEQSYFKNFVKEILLISEEENIEIFELGHEEIKSQYSKNDFLNPQHLNASGATKFTHTLAKYLYEKK